eukprot:6235776-Lingulodinium_polyedra.AAC.1
MSFNVLRATRLSPLCCLGKGGSIVGCCAELATSKPRMRHFAMTKQSDGALRFKSAIRLAMPTQSSCRTPNKTIWWDARAKSFCRSASSFTAANASCRAASATN